MHNLFNSHSYAISNPPFGLSYESSTPCVPVEFDFNELLLLETLKEFREPGFPKPPGCLRCPYLNDNTVHQIYPDLVKQVQSIMDNYNIDEYNAEVLNLQEKYDIEIFEEEMFNLERSQ